MRFANLGETEGVVGSDGLAFAKRKIRNGMMETVAVRDLVFKMGT